MKTPNYIYKMVEPEYTVSKKTKLVNVAGIFFFAVLALIIVFSLLIGENIFKAFSWPVKIVFFIMLIRFFMPGDLRQQTAPLEISFYDDHMVLYRPKKSWNTYYISETVEVNYSDVEKFLWIKHRNRAYLFATVRYIRYKYDKNGNLAATPYENSINKDGNVIKTDKIDGHELVNVIKQYTPINVEVKE